MNSANSIVRMSRNCAKGLCTPSSGESLLQQVLPEVDVVTIIAYFSTVIGACAYLWISDGLFRPRHLYSSYWIHYSVQVPDLPMILIENQLLIGNALIPT